MAVAYTTHNRMLTVALSGDIDHHRVKGLVQDLEREIDEVLPRQLIVDCAGIITWQNLVSTKNTKISRASFVGAEL